LIRVQHPEKRRKLFGVLVIPGAFQVVSVRSGVGIAVHAPAAGIEIGAALGAAAGAILDAFLDRR
jgi:uncharacterized membrane protein